MAKRCLAILSPGDMGHAVGALLAERGFRVVSALGGRSELTCNRAESAGIALTCEVADAVICPGFGGCVRVGGGFEEIAVVVRVFGAVTVGVDDGGEVADVVVFVGHEALAGPLCPDEAVEVVVKVFGDHAAFVPNCFYGADVVIDGFDGLAFGVGDANFTVEGVVSVGGGMAASVSLGVDLAHGSPGRPRRPCIPKG